MGNNVRREGIDTDWARPQITDRRRENHMSTVEPKTPRTARRGRPRKTPNTTSSPEKILDAAEELFAKHGFYGVTIRQVATRAHVDTALLHYYFKTKRGLFDHVFGRRAQVLNEERMASLDRYEREAGGHPTLEGATDAFIRPLIERATSGGTGWKNYFALVAQVNNAPAWGGVIMTRYFDPVVHRFIELLGTLLPAASQEDIYWCYQLLTGSITLTLSQTGRIDRLSGGLCRSSNLNAVYARMVPYAAAGFRSVCVTAKIEERATPTRRGRAARAG